MDDDTEVLICTHKGLMLGFIPVYTEDPNDSLGGTVIWHWSLAVPASITMMLWRLWSRIMGNEYVPIRITGEFDETLYIEVG